jgi:pimeloyl-ACP methyl ester carboxylesterase
MEQVKGVPVLFIPGNAGSYKQVRSLASEAAHYWNERIRPGNEAVEDGKVALDFFTVDFNEDLTAFHGQTLLDQAEYLNDAVAYILSLYHNPARSKRDSSLPDPSSVILVGHSMGGIAARTMLTMPNYQASSVNTIITLSAPHARSPVSFDSQLVNTYAHINDYWRKAHSTRWGSDNPLWHVTLISIAGGGLDTIVPSDYASLDSLVPETHGFTVFTSTIPEVWTGMDHLAITWCDQLRKVLIKSLYDVMDASRAVQTRPRGERMRSFKKWFLTGLEDVAERTLPHKEAKTLLTLEDSSNAIISQGERLALRQLGHHGRKKAYLLPVPPQGSPEGRRFTLLTDQHLDASGETGSLEVLFCSVFPLQVGQSATLFSMNMDLSSDSKGATRLACKNAASDTIHLPASTRHSEFPFDKAAPFSYLQYELEDLAEHQFVAVVDKADQHTAGWVVAEFSSGVESTIRSPVSYHGLITKDLDAKLPAHRSLQMELKIPALQSGLFAYKLEFGHQSCGNSLALFAPLVRQYISSDVYESKFFVNAKEIEINLHGVAPYMPPALRGQEWSNGLSLQIWSDPTCDSPLDVTLSLDIWGSFGKLWMRYRTLFAALPLVVVALVLRMQFTTYSKTGTFMSFSASLNSCLHRSIPAVFLAFSGAALFLTGPAQSLVNESSKHWPPPSRDTNATESFVDYTKNDLLIGSPDPFFWFLMPFFGVISVGLCIAVNYAALAITHLFALVYSWIRAPKTRGEKNVYEITPAQQHLEERMLTASRRAPSIFAVTSTTQRIITTTILLFLVSTVIPYQFAFLVLCIVQIATVVRALRVAWQTVRPTSSPSALPTF